MPEVVSYKVELHDGEDEYLDGNSFKEEGEWVVFRKAGFEVKRIKRQSVAGITTTYSPEDKP